MFFLCLRPHHSRYLSSHCIVFRYGLNASLRYLFSFLRPFMSNFSAAEGLWSTDKSLSLGKSRVTTTLDCTLVEICLTVQVKMFCQFHSGASVVEDHPPRPGFLEDDVRMSSRARLVTNKGSVTFHQKPKRLTANACT